MPLFSLPLPPWEIVTHLGSASVLLPIIVLLALGLWRAGQGPVAATWLVALALAAVATLASKIAFMAWGIGIVPINFTGASGHSLLASAVLPVLFGWLAAGRQRGFSRFGAGFGVFLCIAVGVSRVVLEAHSRSEVAAGWLLGLAVSGVTLWMLHSPSRAPTFARLSPLILLFALSTTLSSYLPTHDWEIRIALFISGHTQQFLR